MEITHTQTRLAVNELRIHFLSFRTFRLFFFRPDTDVRIWWLQGIHFDSYEVCQTVRKDSLRQSLTPKWESFDFWSPRSNIVQQETRCNKSEPSFFQNHQEHISNNLCTWLLRAFVILRRNMSFQYPNLFGILTCAKDEIFIRRRPNDE
jgi:hypothetical protein